MGTRIGVQIQAYDLDQLLTFIMRNTDSEGYRATNSPDYMTVAMDSQCDDEVIWIIQRQNRGDSHDDC